MTTRTKNSIRVVCAVIIAALTALLSSLGLSSCSAMQALNSALRYEYKLNRDSQVQTNTSLTIKNFDEK